LLKQNFMLDKLRAGKPVIGTWAVIPSAITADIIASTGIDFMIMDREHGPLSFETAQHMAIACESRGVSPIMRVGDIERSLIQNALDIGMHGIQVPNVDLPEHAREVVRWSKYPPDGERGFSPFTRAGDYSIANGARLTKTANANTAVILNIEGEHAVSHLDQILEVPGADIIFVGLFDLSKTLGIPGQVDDPRVLALLAEVVEKARSAGLHVGTIATTHEKLVRFIDLGMNYIVYLVDCDVLRGAYANAVDVFRKRTA
jgi:4-hydroxy-2-oxoheptanedioate aldolase